MCYSIALVYLGWPQVYSENEQTLLSFQALSGWLWALADLKPNTHFFIFIIHIYSGALVCSHESSDYDSGLVKRILLSVLLKCWMLTSENMPCFGWKRQLRVKLCKAKEVVVVVCNPRSTK